MQRRCYAFAIRLRDLRLRVKYFNARRETDCQEGQWLNNWRGKMYSITVRSPWKRERERDVTSIYSLHNPLEEDKILCHSDCMSLSYQSSSLGECRSKEICPLEWLWMKRILGFPSVLLLTPTFSCCFLCHKKQEHQAYYWHWGMSFVFILDKEQKNFWPSDTKSQTAVSPDLLFVVVTFVLNAWVIKTHTCSLQSNFSNSREQNK